MSEVFIEVSLSLDGYVAGSGVNTTQPMGLNGKLLHRWLFEPAGPADESAAKDMFANTGAVLIGRRTFDAAIDSWGDDGAFGVPSFVVTNRGHDPVERTRTRFEFVTGGVRRALEAAQMAAGTKNVCIMGGANLAGQYLAAGLVDELRIHLAPVILGQGQRFFQDLNKLAHLDPLPPVHSARATHMRWRVHH